MEFSRNTGVDYHFFSRGSLQPKDQTQVSYTAGGFFTNWATREIVNMFNYTAISKSACDIILANELKGKLLQSLQEHFPSY